MKDVTNEKSTDKELKSGKPPKAAREPREFREPREPRERRERGPPADGIPSKIKVMVANLPYDLTEQKVRHCSALAPNEGRRVRVANSVTPVAQGAFCCLRTVNCQDCASPDPPIHDQKAPGSW